ncbi:hypothetical protein ACFL52_00095 [Candidatus Margulisiibacteriota bacterium]
MNVGTVCKHYRNLNIKLVQKTPNRPIYLGIHCQGFGTLDLIEHAGLPQNLIEVKPDAFKGKDKLFYYRSNCFHIHKNNFARLIRRANKLSLAIQFHFPEELEGKTLNSGLEETHTDIVSLFDCLGSLISDYGFLPNVTMHLPTLFWGSRQMLPATKAEIHSALCNANTLFQRLSAERQAKGWPIILGVENQTDPTINTHALGYSIEHFKIALANTPEWINITIDSGHRILSRNMRLSESFLPYIFESGKKVINLHFHENQGIQSDDYHGDEHKLPFGDYIHGYLMYLNRAVQERIPIILEVKFKRHLPVQILLVSMGIKGLLDSIELGRKAHLSQST